MITTEQIIIEKKLPFDADYIENEFIKRKLNIVRWAIVKVTDENFIIDAAVMKK